MRTMPSQRKGDVLKKACSTRMVDGSKNEGDVPPLLGVKHNNEDRGRATVMKISGASSLEFDEVVLVWDPRHHFLRRSVHS